MRGVSIVAVVLIAGCGNGRQPLPDRTSSPPSATAARDVGEHIIAELNALRKDPEAYSRKINGRRQYYRGNVLALPGQVPLRTQEGVAALDEAVGVLQDRKPLPVVDASPSLAAGARDHVSDIGPKGLLAHEGSDGSSPSQRVARYASGFASIGEVISFGPDDPASVVIGLIVDDGVRDRGHRKILLDPTLKVGGAACGSHAVYRTMCVIDLADHVAERR